VATAAVLAKLTIMHVVEFVAVATITTNPGGHGSQRLPVAVVARDRCVCTIEKKIRLRIVIKQPQVPIDRVVTEAAFIAVSILVRIVVGVTGYTFCLRQLEFVRLVTILALSFHVLSEQRKDGQAMVEPHIFSPG
jgi:hypothetical protein